MTRRCTRSHSKYDSTWESIFLSSCENGKEKISLLHGVTGGCSIHTLWPLNMIRISYLPLAWISFLDSNFFVCAMFQTSFIRGLFNSRVFYFTISYICINIYFNVIDIQKRLNAYVDWHHRRLRGIVSILLK